MTINLAKVEKAMEYLDDMVTHYLETEDANEIEAVAGMLHLSCLAAVRLGQRPDNVSSAVHRICQNYLKDLREQAH